jgi:hypothetical protein
VASSFSPARATLATGLPEGPVSRIGLAGERLNGGGGNVAARIVLRAPHWQALAPPVRAVRLDPALNPAWNVTLGAMTASFDMQASVDVDLGGGPPTTLDVVPGFYTVSIEVEHFRQTPAGTTASTLSQSNLTLVSLGARILTSDPPSGAGRIMLHLANLFDVTDAALDVQLAIDGQIYHELTTFTGTAAKDAGHFVRVAADRIEFHPAFAIVAGEAHPVRLVINGAESQPFWAVMP